MPALPCTQLHAAACAVCAFSSLRPTGTHTVSTAVGSGQQISEAAALQQRVWRGAGIELLPMQSQLIARAGSLVLPGKNNSARQLSSASAVRGRAPREQKLPMCEAMCWLEALGRLG